MVDVVPVACTIAASTVNVPAETAGTVLTHSTEDLLFDVLRDIPGIGRLGSCCAGRGLLRIVHLDFGEIQADVFSQAILTARTAGRNRSYQHVRHGDNEVFQRGFAGFPYGKNRFIKMLSIAAGELKVAGRLIDIFGEVQIGDIDLAGTGTASDLGAAAVGHPPAPRQHIDLFLMARISRFAFNRTNLNEHIDCHSRLLFFLFTGLYEN